MKDRNRTIEVIDEMDEDYLDNSILKLVELGFMKRVDTEGEESYQITELGQKWYRESFN